MTSLTDLRQRLLSSPGVVLREAIQLTSQVSEKTNERRARARNLVPRASFKFALILIQFSSGLETQGQFDCTPLLDDVLGLLQTNVDPLLATLGFAFILSIVKPSSPSTPRILETLALNVENSPSSEIRALALRTLGNLPLAPALAELFNQLPRALQSPAAEVRVQACRALPRILTAQQDGLSVRDAMTAALVDELVYATNDDHPQVRIAALTAIFLCERLLQPSSPAAAAAAAAVSAPALLRMDAPGKLQRVLDLVPLAHVPDKVALLDLVAVSLPRAVPGSASAPAATSLGPIVAVAASFTSHAAPAVVLAAVRLLTACLARLRPADVYSDRDLALAVLARTGPPLKALVGGGSESIQLLACQALRVLLALQSTFRERGVPELGVGLGMRDVPELLPRHDDTHVLTCEKLLVATQIASLSPSLSGAATGAGEGGKEAQVLFESLQLAMTSSNAAVSTIAARLMGSVGFDAPFVLDRMQAAAALILGEPGSGSGASQSGPGSPQPSLASPPGSGNGASASGGLSIFPLSLAPDAILVCLKELLLRTPAEATVGPARICRTALSLVRSSPLVDYEAEPAEASSTVLGPQGRAAAAYIAGFTARVSPESAFLILKTLTDIARSSTSSTDIELFELLSASARVAVVSGDPASASHGLFTALSDLCTTTVQDPLVRGRAEEIARLLRAESLLGPSESDLKSPSDSSPLWFSVGSGAAAAGVLDPALGPLDLRALTTLSLALGKASVAAACSLEGSMEAATGRVIPLVESAASWPDLQPSLASIASSPAHGHGQRRTFRTPAPAGKPVQTTFLGFPRSASGPADSNSFGAGAQAHAAEPAAAEAGATPSRTPSSLLGLQFGGLLTFGTGASSLRGSEISAPSPSNDSPATAPVTPRKSGSLSSTRSNSFMKRLAAAGGSFRGQPTPGPGPASAQAQQPGSAAGTASAGASDLLPGAQLEFTGDLERL